jgi:thioredoxin reductase
VNIIIRGGASSRIDVEALLASKIKKAPFVVHRFDDVRQKVFLQDEIEVSAACNVEVVTSTCVQW